MFEGHADVIELLLAAGASATLESGGLQPCHVAARKGHLGAIEVLQAHNERLVVSKTEDGASIWCVQSGGALAGRFMPHDPPC